MKKISSFVFACLAGAMPYGNGAPFDGTRAVYEQNPHHVYFGPEVFFFDLNTHVECIHVEGQKVFGGLGLGYEYLKPKAFYAGISLLGTLTHDSFNARWDGCWIDSSKDGAWFGKGTVRGGYTFGFGDGLLTPFVGVGGYGFGDGSDFTQSAFYVATGLRSQWGVVPFFDLGMNLEVFYSGCAERKFSYSAIKCKEGKGMWGGEIGIPLTWHVDPTRRWDVRFEPYFSKIDFSEIQNIYGVHFLLGYRF